MVAQLLRRSEVQALTSLGRSTLFAMVASGKFPKPIPLSARRVAWLSSDVEAWLADRVSARDARNAPDSR